MKTRFLFAAIAAGLFGPVSLVCTCLLPAVQAGEAPARENLGTASSTRYMADVVYLASDAMKGRASGSPELEQAADGLGAKAIRQALR